jgi:hypothetical protein
MLYFLYAQLGNISNKIICCCTNLQVDVLNSNISLRSIEKVCKKIFLPLQTHFGILTMRQVSLLCE